MSIKQAWDSYGGLIIWVGGIVTFICSASIFVATLVLNEMIDTRIENKVGTTASVSALTTNVALNTDAINDLGDQVGGLDTSIRDLNGDVKATLRILAAQ